jgi:2-polyprenyl-3-methyl-5-hydroxy-6-metoxy-1,4-benzoquinol methylase
MTPLVALRSVNRISPGTMLDIGARDLIVSKTFLELGYEVDAIDPVMPKSQVPHGIAFLQTTFEEFETDKSYDLVIASLVSQFVKYDLRELLEKLKSLTHQDGSIYVTLIGEQDGWNEKPAAKAITVQDADLLIEDLDLKTIYKATELFDGLLYSGEPKRWHLHSFVLEHGKRE